MNRTELLKTYAGIVTSALVFTVYMFIMWTYTTKDLLEIITVYCVFLMGPSYLIPYLIAGENESEGEDEDTDGTGA